MSENTLENNPRINRLHEIIAMEKRRIALQMEIDLLISRINELQKAAYADLPVSSSKRNGEEGGRLSVRRGGLKAAILSLLNSSGAEGITVNDIAAATGSRAANIFAWFQSTGKKIEQVVKVGKARYAVTSPVDFQPPLPKVNRKKGRGIRNSRGGLTQQIVRALEAAGAEGLTLVEIAAAAGSKPRNVSVWVSTTGKQFPQIVKVGKGRYGIRPPLG
jgi:hypothetical protein